MDFVAGYVAELIGRAENYERDGIVDGARIYRRVAEELEARQRAFQNEEVTIAQAAMISGYDESAIRKMRSDGRLPTPLRRCDIPRKPGHGVARSRPVLAIGGGSLAADQGRGRGSDPGVA